MAAHWLSAAREDLKLHHRGGSGRAKRFPRQPTWHPGRHPRPSQASEPRCRRQSQLFLTKLPAWDSRFQNLDKGRMSKPTI